MADKTKTQRVQKWEQEYNKVKAEAPKNSKELDELIKKERLLKVQGKELSQGDKKTLKELQNKKRIYDNIDKVENVIELKGKLEKDRKAIQDELKSRDESKKLSQESEKIDNDLQELNKQLREKKKELKELREALKNQTNQEKLTELGKKEVELTDSIEKINKKVNQNNKKFMKNQEDLANNSKKSELSNKTSDELKKEEEEIGSKIGKCCYVGKRLMEGQSVEYILIDYEKNNNVENKEENQDVKNKDTEFMNYLKDVAKIGMQKADENIEKTKKENAKAKLDDLKKEAFKREKALYGQEYAERSYKGELDEDNAHNGESVKDNSNKGELEKDNPNNGEAEKDNTNNEGLEKDNLNSRETTIGKIIGIEIVEGSDKINIAKVGEDGQIQNITIENKLKEILKNKKEIFKNPEIAKIIDVVEPSRFKQYFLKRKLSPVILNVLSENKQGSSMIDYVVAIKREENCENLKIKHDLSNTVLKGRLKRMMKRVAKTEHFIDGMEVKGLKETKAMGLLESGKRKLKNKPATIKEGIKLVGKSLGRGTKNGFKQAMKVPKAIKNKLDVVAKTYRDEDLEKLEDKEDLDLEETETKENEEEAR